MEKYDNMKNRVILSQFLYIDSEYKIPYYPYFTEISILFNRKNAKMQSM